MAMMELLVFAAAYAKGNGIMADGIQIAPLPQSLGTHMAPPRRDKNRIAKQGMQGFALAALYEANTIAHFMHGDGRSLTMQIQ